MTPKQITDTFFKFATLQESALEKSKKDRARITKEIEAGQIPTGDRVEWIKDTATKILNLLKLQAIKYNETHPGDIITVMDFGDALATCMSWVKSGSRKKETD